MQDTFVSAKTHLKFRVIRQFPKSNHLSWLYLTQKYASSRNCLRNVFGRFQYFSYCIAHGCYSKQFKTSLWISVASVNISISSKILKVPSLNSSMLLMRLDRWFNRVLNELTLKPLRVFFNWVLV